MYRCGRTGKVFLEKSIKFKNGKSRFKCKFKTQYKSCEDINGKIIAYNSFTGIFLSIYKHLPSFSGN